MSRFLIEVPHADNREECLRVVHVFLNTGSHFLSNAEWGCMDGEHKAWLIVDVNSKDDARSILPPAYRQDAKITELRKFTLDKIEEEMSYHQISPTQ